MAYRAMLPRKAIELIESLFRYNGEYRRLESVDNIMPRHYVQEVFALSSNAPGITIFYEVKADLSEHEITILANAGVRRIQPGMKFSDLHTPINEKRARRGRRMYSSCATA